MICNSFFTVYQPVRHFRIPKKSPRTTIMEQLQSLHTVLQVRSFIVTAIFLDSDFGSRPFDNADIFDTIFSTFGSGRNPEKGFQTMVDLDANVETHLRLSFLEAALGCKKSIRYKRDVLCGSCSGSGSSKGSSPSICPSCKGTGQVRNILNTLLKFTKYLRT